MSNRIKLSVLVLVLANLIPIAGVLLWDWDVLVLLLLFWCENVIIGFFGILKILASGNGVIQTVFFSLHYGGFMFGHLMVLLGLFARPDDEPGQRVPNSELFQDVIVNRVTLLPIVALFVSHGWSFVTNFLLTAERQNLTSAQAMAMPYKRMVITHVALIAGAFLLQKTGEPLVGLLLLTGMKIALDITFHRREHQLSDLA